MTLNSANAIELLGNALSALVLDQLDNMGSLILFNWVKSSYNRLASAPNFMVVKTNRSIESILTASAWMLSIIMSVLNTYQLFDETFFLQVKAIIADGTLIQIICFNFTWLFAGITIYTCCVYKLYSCRKGAAQKEEE